MDRMDINLGITWFVAFLFSTTVHEAAHAWAGYRMGDLTAYAGGQVSLDPRPHVKREPVGMIVVPILSLLMHNGQFVMGWASAPYNPNWARRYPKRAALMALAGPLSNLVVALIAGILIRIGILVGLFRIPEEVQLSALGHLVSPASGAGGVAHALAMLLSVLFALNLILAILNLMPLPPLDGSAIPPLFMGYETALHYRNWISGGLWPMIGLLLVWNYFWVIFAPIWRASVILLYFPHLW